MPVNDPVIAQIVGGSLPAIAGVVVVVMEEDAWPDRLATDGYVALVDAVKLAVVNVTRAGHASARRGARRRGQERSMHECLSR
ncbi:hypothetical protein ABH927_000522 [Planotetraspora sp. GP83]